MVVMFGTTTGVYNYKNRQWELDAGDVAEHPHMIPLLWAPFTEEVPERPDQDYLMEEAMRFKPVAAREELTVH